MFSEIKKNIKLQEKSGRQLISWHAFVMTAQIIGNLRRISASYITS